jgi:hypothetical protein
VANSFGCEKSYVDMFDWLFYEGDMDELKKLAFSSLKVRFINVAFDIAY